VGEMFLSKTRKAKKGKLGRTNSGRCNYSQVI